MNKHNGNDLYIEIIAQAIEEMKEVQGESFSLENVNLAELERRTGITRARLRRMKANGFKSVPHGRSGQKADSTVLSGYTSTLDSLLKIGVTNSVVFLRKGSRSIRRETEAVVTGQDQARLTRWTGVLHGSQIRTVTSIKSPVSQ